MDDDKDDGNMGACMEKLAFDPFEPILIDPKPLPLLPPAFAAAVVAAPEDEPADPAAPAAAASIRAAAAATYIHILYLYMHNNYHKSSSQKLEIQTALTGSMAGRHTVSQRL